MMNLRSKGGERKASKRPYMKLFTSDYRDGTAQLSFELQGFYFRILTYLHDGDVVPSDPAKLATFLQCSPRTVRAYVPKLIAAGKLYEVDGELRNKRIDRDLEPNSDRVEAEVDLSSIPIGAEVEPKSSRTLEKTESNQEAENHTMEKATSTATSIAREENTRSTITLGEQADRPQSDRYSNLKSAFNGSTEAMLDDVQRFMGPLADRQNAINWLTGTLTRYGDDRTVEAWTIVTSRAGGNRPVGNPLAFWAKTADGLKAKPKQADRANMVFKPNRYGPGRWVPKEAVQ